MLRIRLTRHGAKKDPHYRIVVADRPSPRDGRFVEILGYYNPAMKPARLKLDLDRADYWLGNGAQPTRTVKTLITKVRKQEEEPDKEPVQTKPAQEEKAAETEGESDKAAISEEETAEQKDLKDDS